MKLGRRAFLQFAAGAVGGTLLSPIPWQLMDDSAIWSQNWWFRPSPERGEITKVATTCLLCDGGCGIQARLVNKNRAILLEGNPKNPVNAGGICPLGRSRTAVFVCPLSHLPTDETDEEARGCERVAAYQLGGSPQGTARQTGPTQSLKARPRRSPPSPGSDQAAWMPCGSSFLRLTAPRTSSKCPPPLTVSSLAAGLTAGKKVPFAFALEDSSYVLSFGADLIEGWGAPVRMQSSLCALAAGKQRQGSDQDRSGRIPLFSDGSQSRSVGGGGSGYGSGPGPGHRSRAGQGKPLR